MVEFAPPVAGKEVGSVSRRERVTVAVAPGEAVAEAPKIPRADFCEEVKLKFRFVMLKFEEVQLSQDQRVLVEGLEAKQGVNWE